MKKETIIAIAFGIIFGAVVAIIIISQNKQSKLQNNKEMNPHSNVTPSIAKTNVLTALEVSEPATGTIIGKNNISIKGNAPKNAVIIIQSPIKDVVVKAENGTFSTNFPLALGENTITITSYAKEGQIQTQEKEIRVYYLDEQL